MTNKTQNQEREAKEKARRVTAKDVCICIAGTGAFMAALSGLMYLQDNSELAKSNARQHAFEAEINPLRDKAHANFDSNGDGKLRGDESKALARAVGFKGPIHEKTRAFLKLGRHEKREVVLTLSLHKDYIPDTRTTGGTAGPYEGFRNSKVFTEGMGPMGGLLPSIGGGSYESPYVTERHNFPASKLKDLVRKTQHR